MDKYDSPFTEILHKRPDVSLIESEKLLLEGMKKVMEDLLGEIKSLINQQLVKLNYITGVSRLAFDSLPGSGPNNVVTLKDKYAYVVGFTEDEIEQYLSPHIKKFAKTEDMTPKDITEKLLSMEVTYFRILAEKKL